MSKKIYFQILFIPMILIFLSIASVTIYNVLAIQKYNKQSIEKLTNDFIEQNKEKIKYTVEQLVIDINYIKKQAYKRLKIDLKNKVDNLVDAVNQDYEYNKNDKSTKKLQQKLLELIRSQNKANDEHYFFVLDIKTGKALVHNVKKYKGQILKDKIDITGTNTFLSKVEKLQTKNSAYQELYFEKPNEGTKQFKKLVYFKKFEQFNWIIGSGSYLDDEEKKLQKMIVTKYNKIQTNLSKYLFVLKLHDINGGKDFATHLVQPNNLQSVGKKISDDRLDLNGKPHRKEYLKGLREDGDAFVEYWYLQPNGIDQGRKLSYFYHYKPWNWVIGSGFYFDNLDRDIKTKEEILNKQIQTRLNNSILIGLLFLLIALLLSYLFTRNIKENIEKYIKVIDNKNKVLKKRKEEMKQKNSIMIQQSKMASMGEMIGNIAHQWRQPLNALGLTIQKIKMYHDEEMLTQKELDKAVEKSKMLINKMSTTIDDFRNFFRVDKVKQNFSINDAIENTLSLLEASLKSKHITVEKKMETEEIVLLGFKNEFEQVILNILNNAKDALVEKNIENPTIVISSSIQDSTIKVNIKDNAGGIPSDIINKIFDPYFTTKEQGKGTGIGLYMSKMIIQTNMYGTISVENEKDGASFIIEISKDIKDA